MTDFCSNHYNGKSSNDARGKERDKMGVGEKQEETGTEGFTERAIMSLVVEAAELKETALRFVAVVAALALAHGISTEI